MSITDVDVFQLHSALHLACLSIGCCLLDRPTLRSPLRVVNRVFKTQVYAKFVAVYLGDSLVCKRNA
jgi:hypothetical protein